MDNIHVDNSATIRPAGTSADAGRRRLDKAADAGDERAVDLDRSLCLGAVYAEFMNG